jgi:hypothetical protein
MGGFGNQAFIWALGVALEARGAEVQYDTSLLDADAGRRYLLGDLGLKLPIVKGENPTLREGSLRFQPEFLNLKNGVLQGYFQSERYFLDVQHKIREMAFKNIQLSPRTRFVASKIYEMGEYSCFLHVRRSDNLRPTSTLYQGLATLHGNPYYERALAILRKRGAHFFIFSDDPAWANQVACPVDFTVVSHNAPSFSVDHTHNLHKNCAGREVEDLWLMSLCRHAIIGNSTFSWWGAWLSDWNKDERRIVTAPDPWFSSGDLDATDIIPARWTKVSTR